MEFLKEENRFYLADGNGETYAEVTYWIAGDKLLIIDHTYVHPKYQGEGIAKGLIYAVVTKARQEDKKVVPLCPFANAEFERNMAYQDVKR